MLRVSGISPSRRDSRSELVLERRRVYEERSSFRRRVSRVCQAFLNVTVCTQKIRVCRVLYIILNVRLVCDEKCVSSTRDNVGHHTSQHEKKQSLMFRPLIFTQRSTSIVFCRGSHSRTGACARGFPEGPRSELLLHVLLFLAPVLTVA
jgi:hypothetical protein